MDEGKISVRYAKALLGLAKEKQVEEAVKTDMEMIHQPVSYTHLTLPTIYSV